MKRSKKILLLIFLFHFMTSSAWADGQLKVPLDKIVLEKNRALPLCQEISQILQLPENKNYIKSKFESNDYSALKLFEIPSQYKNFVKLKWKYSSFEELQKVAPIASKEIPKTFDKDMRITVYKTNLYIANSKKSRPTYEFIAQNKNGFGYKGLFMQEQPDDLTSEKMNERLGSGAKYDPFYYKGLIYFSHAEKNSISIYYPKWVEPFGLALEDVCYLTAKGEKFASYN